MYLGRREDSGTNGAIESVASELRRLTRTIHVESGRLNASEDSQNHEGDALSY